MVPIIGVIIGVIGLCYGLYKDQKAKEAEALIIGELRKSTKRWMIYLDRFLLSAQLFEPSKIWNVYSGSVDVYQMPLNNEQMAKLLKGNSDSIRKINEDFRRIIGHLEDEAKHGGKFISKPLEHECDKLKRYIQQQSI